MFLFVCFISRKHFLERDRSEDCNRLFCGDDNTGTKQGRGLLGGIIATGNLCCDFYFLIQTVKF